MIQKVAFVIIGKPRSMINAFENTTHSITAPPTTPAKNGMHDPNNQNSLAR
jgi:hypothetical protein